MLTFSPQSFCPSVMVLEARAVKQAISIFLRNLPSSVKDIQPQPPEGSQPVTAPRASKMYSSPGMGSKPVLSNHLLHTHLSSPMVCQGMFGMLYCICAQQSRVPPHGADALHVADRQTVSSWALLVLERTVTG